MSLSREYVVDGKPVAVRAEHVGGDHWRVRVGAKVMEFRVGALGPGALRLVPVGSDAGPATVAHGAPAGEGYQVRVAGRTHQLEVPAARGSSAGSGADGRIRAPMTGTVTKLQCAVGERVAADQVLVVMTAMKMEHKLTAGLAGIVVEVAAAEGAIVDSSAVLVRVEPSPVAGEK